jgi:prepilin-type processing-associated H-X9-DG protein
MFYEGTPQGDGTRAVLFVDGHVERLSPERFTRVRNTAVTLRAVESPAAVTSRVKAALRANAATRDGDIDVSVNSTQQTVTLTGTAKSAQQSWRAQSTARQAATEYRIVNRLSVRATKTTKAR